MIIIGVDPGLHGALCALRIPDICSIIDLPLQSRMVQRKGKAPAKRNDIDAYALSAEIKRITEKDGHVLAFQELVTARNTDGSVQAGAFLGCAHEIRGVIKAHFIPFEEVATKSWRHALHIPRPPSAGDKSLVVAKATNMFPEQAHLWKYKCHADRAEAALIAMYGWLKMNGGFSK